MNMMESSCVPPGFRFHPTEEELVGYYLNRKVNDLKIDLDVITDIDLYRMEPWDIQDKCNLGYEEQSEWYFFSHKDRKYPTGTRTNRATAAGFWKATGRDKAVLSKEKLIGMRKTLVFYNGRAPNGRKTDWIMHEYRLQVSQHCPPQEEGWVVCRAFKKPCPSHQQKQGYEAWTSSPSYNYAYYNNYNRSSSENMANFQPPPPQQQPPTSIFRPNFEQIPYASDHQDQLIMLSNQQQTSFIDNINNDYHLPQLDDSSSTFVTKEALINNNNDREEEEDEEWKLLEAVSRADHVIEPSSLFVSQINHQPLLLPAHHRDHLDHELLLGCFSTTTDV